jgi:hypothetical protein
MRPVWKDGRSLNLIALLLNVILQLLKAVLLTIQVDLLQLIEFLGTDVEFLDQFLFQICSSVDADSLFPEIVKVLQGLLVLRYFGETRRRQMIGSDILQQPIFRG